MKYLPVWKEAPFLRLVTPLIAGIAIQWYVELPFIFTCMLGATSFISLIVWRQATFRHFRYFWIRGMLLNLLIISMGCIMAVCRDGAFGENSLIRQYTANDYVVAKLEEPLSEKANAYEARASVQYLISEKNSKPVQGLVILYFQKREHFDSLRPLQYGDWIIFHKKL